MGEGALVLFGCAGLANVVRYDHQHSEELW